MNELLEQMLGSELLNDETKQQLKEAFDAELNKIRQEAREEAIAEAKVEYATQYADEKAALVEAIDTKVTAFLQEELAELKEDIERFRDLEAEYAANLIEAKEQLGLQLQADMAQLVETIDDFLEESMTEQFEELKESIEEVKKIDFAKKLFESFEGIYRDKFFDESGMAAQLKESAKALEEKTKALNEAKAELNKINREQKMASVLEPLQGRPREIMEAILKSVATDKLDEAYENFIGRVLHESVTVVENKSEKESVNTSVLAESHSTEETPETTVVVTGDSTVVEHAETEKKVSVLSESTKAQLRKLSGIN